MLLTKDEIVLILDLMREKYGHGYADGAAGRLQAKLSIMLQAKIQVEAADGL